MTRKKWLKPRLTIIELKRKILEKQNFLLWPKDDISG